jgi:hypothetical protein
MHFSRQIKMKNQPWLLRKPFSENESHLWKIIGGTMIGPVKQRTITRHFKNSVLPIKNSKFKIKNGGFSQKLSRYSGCLSFKK